MHDAQEAGMVAVRRAAAHPKSSLKVLKAVWKWCTVHDDGVSCSTEFFTLSAIRVRYLKRGLLPPTSIHGVHGNEVFTFHGVVPGKELRLHLHCFALSMIELPPRRCDVPPGATDLDLHAFDAKHWRQVLPYAVTSDRENDVWRRVAVAVSRVAARQNALFSVLTAADTAPAAAWAAMVRMVHRPSMLFQDRLVWNNEIMWHCCAWTPCAPTILWLMVAAQAPRYAAHVRTMKSERGFIYHEILFLAGAVTPYWFPGWPCPNKEAIMNAWAVDTVVSPWFPVVVQRDARWRAGRAAWAAAAAT
jgi:hypothetical protein